MLSRTAEYALRAMVLLGRHYDERSVSADEIATHLGAPRNYLSKTLNALARHGLLLSARGPGGGFSLARPPREISIANVVDVFAERRPGNARCLLGDSPCDAAHPCAAHVRWNAITNRARQPMDHTTIAQLFEPVPTMSLTDHDDTRSASHWPDQINGMEPCR